MLAETFLADQGCSVTTELLLIPTKWVAGRSPPAGQTHDSHTDHGPVTPATTYLHTTCYSEWSLHVAGVESRNTFRYRTVSLLAIQQSVEHKQCQGGLSLSLGANSVFSFQDLRFEIILSEWNTDIDKNVLKTCFCSFMRYITQTNQNKCSLHEIRLTIKSKQNNHNLTLYYITDNISSFDRIRTDNQWKIKYLLMKKVIQKSNELQVCLPHWFNSGVSRFSCGMCRDKHILCMLRSKVWPWLAQDIPATWCRARAMWPLSTKLIYHTQCKLYASWPNAYTRSTL